MKLGLFLSLTWADDRCWSPDSPYTGTISKQVGGVPCQSWDRDFPNTVAHYPKDALYSNYCRNPDNDPIGPWCYTNSFTVKEHQRYGYCDIPKCQNFQNKRRKQTACSTESAYYKGDQSVSETGKPCLNWNEVEESSLFTRFQKFSTPTHNKCRNPNKDGGGPWCYVKVDVWQPFYHQETKKERCAIERTKKYNDCPVGCLSDPIGASYQGKASVTSIGYVCQRWDMNYPTRTGPNDVLPPENDRDHNFCRNPDNDPSGPWCYAVSKSWGKAYCDIPFCSGVQPDHLIRPTQAPTHMSLETGYTSTESQSTYSQENNQMQQNVRPMSVNIPIKSTSRPTTRPKRQNVACGIPALAVPRNIMKQATDLESPYNYLYTERGLNRNKRIYGGEQATAGTIPWIVTFVFGDPTDSLARCGGSIIGPNFVVTAAHCAYGQTPSSVNITAGTFSYSGTESTAKNLKVKKIINHPQYMPGRNEFDIALIQIETITEWTQTMRPICLPKGDEKFENGNMCMVAGWGATETASVSRFLRYTIIPKLPTSICDSWLFAKLDYNVEFCAGWEEGVQDSCTGDSGGPFMCRHGSTWKLYGVVSWGEGCGKPNKPGIYADVRAFATWIRKTARETMRSSR